MKKHCKLFHLFMALVMLAALSISFGAEGGALFWLSFLLKLGFYMVGAVLVIPRLTRYFLRRYSDAVMQYIYVLSVMFLNAALTSLIGLEGIFGAFFSGLILNRYIPHVSPLMNRIEFIGNAIFIPYILIGVGMLINVRTLPEIRLLVKVLFVTEPATTVTFSEEVAARP